MASSPESLENSEPLIAADILEARGWDDEQLQAFREYGQPLPPIINNGDNGYPLPPIGITETHSLLYYYPESPDRPPTSEIILAEQTPDGRFVGYGTIMYVEGSTDEPDANRPYVSWVETVGTTETAEGFQNQGLGMQRYRNMNQLAFIAFGKPLHSDLSPYGETTPEAASVWQKLVASGEAEIYDYDDKGQPRFRFTS